MTCEMKEFGNYSLKISAHSSAPGKRLNVSGRGSSSGRAVQVKNEHMRAPLDFFGSGEVSNQCDQIMLGFLKIKASILNKL